MLHLTFSYWWLFAIALVLILAFGGKDMGQGLLLALLVVILLTTVACKLAAHFGLL